MITTLYLVRHGETEGSDARRYKGSIDVPLSEKGIHQMKESSDFIRGYLESVSSSKYLSYLKDIHTISDAGPDSGAGARKPEATQSASALQSFRTSRLEAVYTSNLSRAARSAKVIAEPYGLLSVETPDFRERNFGVWEGMSFTEIKEKYPQEFESWANNPLKYSPVGGESTVEVKDRVLPSLNRILSNHKGENIAVVAHGGVNRIILCHLLGIPLENIFRIEQDYAAVNIIEFWEKYPVLKLLNG